MKISSQIAKIYNKHGRDYHQSRKEGKGRLNNEYIDIPTTFSLLPKNLKGSKVLDAGCGSGLYANKLAKKGAKVFGIDISTEMIKIAKEETPKKLGIEYVVSNLEKIKFKNNSFDIIICSYVLENIISIDKVFKEFYRILKKNGYCIFSMSHPLKAQSISTTIKGKKVRIIENYFEKGIRYPNFGNGMIVPKFKRPFEEYAKAINKAGFLISNILEPRPLAIAKKIDPNGYESANRIPEIITVKIVKC